MYLYFKKKKFLTDFRNYGRQIGSSRLLITSSLITLRGKKTVEIEYQNYF